MCVFCSERCRWWNVNHNKSEPLAYGPLSLCKYNSYLFYFLFFPSLFPSHKLNYFMSEINFVWYILISLICFFVLSYVFNIQVASNGVPPSISKRVLLRVQCKLFIQFVQFARIHFFFYFVNRVKYFMRKKISILSIAELSSAQLKCIIFVFALAAGFFFIYSIFLVWYTFSVDNIFSSVFIIFCCVSFYNCLRILHVLVCVLYFSRFFFSPLLFSVRLVWYCIGSSFCEMHTIQICTSENLRFTTQHTFIYTQYTQIQIQHRDKSNQQQHRQYTHILLDE